MQGCKLSSSIDPMNPSPPPQKKENPNLLRIGEEMVARLQPPPSPLLPRAPPHPPPLPIPKKTATSATERAAEREALRRSVVQGAIQRQKGVLSSSSALLLRASGAAVRRRHREDIDRARNAVAKLERLLLLR